jgi:uncharacterized membrane protein
MSNHYSIYLILKSVHILSVVLFLGNIIVTGWWKLFADFTQQPETLKFAQRQVTLTDYVFTLVGSTLIFISGIGMIHLQKLDFFHTPWLLWGTGLFLISGVLWLLLLIPLQIKLARLSRTLTANSPVPEIYWTLEKWWLIIGVIAIILPIITLFLMVLKP